MGIAERPLPIDDGCTPPVSVALCKEWDTRGAARHSQTLRRFSGIVQRSEPLAQSMSGIERLGTHPPGRGEIPAMHMRQLITAAIASFALSLGVSFLSRGPPMSRSTRRQFMLSSATQAASLALVLNGKLISLPPFLLPKPAGPNERVNLGFIGFGIRGNILLESAKETQQANLVEACDCYQGHLERAKERTDGRIATNFSQYKKLLDRKDIDAVIIATPDHWHLPMVLDALDAGKDVYLEKPLTHRLEDGPKMIDAARRTRHVVQVGSQGRSSPLQK